MTKSVSHIFGGEAKVKIMRLFIFNPDSVYEARTISDRTKERPILVRKRLNELMKAGLLKKRSRGFTLDKEYPYLVALRNFLIDAGPITEKQIIKKFSKVGAVKLILISGIFLHDNEARVDLLVVGDHLKKNKIVSAISSIEAELGREIRYATFETADFHYRFGMYDKLILDILDAKNHKILNKLSI
jgi:hypothetical protein